MKILSWIFYILGGLTSAMLLIAAYSAGLQCVFEYPGYYILLVAFESFALGHLFRKKEKKKILAGFAVSVALFVALVAFDNLHVPKNVKTYIALIDEIGTVDLDSFDKIRAAREFYPTLSLHEMDLVNKLYPDAKDTVAAAYDQWQHLENVNSVEKKIDAIGVVSLDSYSEIKLARDVYDRSSDATVKDVKNYQVLVDAENTFESLVNVEVKEVIKQISSIGTVNLNKSDLINDISHRYYNIPAHYRESVTNGDVLIAAKEKVDKLQYEKDHADEIVAVNKMRKKNDEVQNCTFYSHQNAPIYTNSRSNLLPYIGKRGSSTWLRMTFDYTGSSWVFFTKVTISIDGNNSVYSWNYWDITRDSAGRGVAEYIDVEGDVELLERIANSEKTIIRFEGDDYRSDLTVSASDKQIIKDVLLAYEYLKHN